MSTMKKIGALIMALAMCFALAMPAFAADKTGTIVVEKPEPGKTYTAYRIFDAVTGDNGTDNGSVNNELGGSVVYYADATQKAYWEDKGIFEFTAVTFDDNKFSVALKENVTSDMVGKFFNDNKDTLINTAGVVKEEGHDDDNNGEVKLTGLPLGYYFVASDDGSVVTLDTTNDAVHIVDKNNYSDPFEPSNPDHQLKDVFAVNGVAVEYPTDGNGNVTTPAVSVKIGDTVTYQVSTTTSNYVTYKVEGSKKVMAQDGDISEKVEYVYITDTIGDGLSFVDKDTFKDSLKVKKNDDDFSAYSLSFGGNTFTITIPWVDDKGNSLYNNGDKITVWYDATVQKEIDVVDENGTPAQNATNGATVGVQSTPKNEDPKPDPDPTTEVEVEKSEVGVYVYAMAILKTDAKDNSGLPGAHFTISKKGENGELGEALKFNKDTTDGVYYFDKNGTTDLISDFNGNIVIRGVDNGDYVATETQAPEGFNPLDAPVDIASAVAGETKSTTTVTTTIYKDADGNIVDTKTETTTEEKKDTKAIEQKTIQNRKGAELPSTGGIGTTIFYVVGGAMVVGAGVLLIVKKRMAE